MKVVSDSTESRLISIPVFVIIVTSLLAGNSRAAEVPWEFHVLIDTSNSMKGTPDVPEAEHWQSTISEVQRQLSGFCDDLPRETKVFIYAFDDEFRTVTPAGGLSIFEETDRVAVREMFHSVEVRNRKTYLWSALGRVLENASNSVVGTPGRKLVRVLVYTDGNDNEEGGPGPRVILEKYRKLIEGPAKGQEEFKVQLITLGFDLRAEDRKVVESYGGKVDRAGTQLTPLFANFTWFPKRPAVGDEIQFVDRSTGLVRDQVWDFGDGAKEWRTRAPVHVFEKPGTFRVRLEIASPSRRKEAIALDVPVRPREQLDVAFRRPAGNVYVGQAVTFVNDSTGPIDSFAWDFEDGQSSKAVHPTHVYQKAGSYVVRLTAKAADGREASYELPLSDAVRVAESAVDFFAPAAVTVNEPVSFRARADGLIDELIWSFGDGSTPVRQRDIEHRFTAAGRFKVELVGRGPGGEYSKVREIRVLPHAQPRVDVVSPAKEAIVGQAVQFFGRVDGPVDEMTWDFGDGSPVQSGLDAKHTFENMGIYPVKFSATGPGGSDSKTLEVRIVGFEPPEVKAFSRSLEAIVGQPIEFFGQLVSGTAATAQWDFGDGSPAVSGFDAKHAFQKTGSYTITFSAEGPGGVDSATTSVEVVKLKPAEVDFFSVAEATIGEPVKFFGRATSGVADDLIWNFGDGSSAKSGRDLEHVFKSAGRFNVTLEGIGPGGKGRKSRTIEVSELTEPEVEILPVRRVKIGEPLQFFSRLGGLIDEFRWDFGDGTLSSVEQDPQHEYTDAGEYQVTLTATGPGGASKATVNVEIEDCVPPVAELLAPERARVGEPVQFFAGTSGFVEGVHWDFGDGKSEAGQADATHEFSKPGTYAVKVTVSGPDGSGIDSKEIEIVPFEVPAAAFEIGTGQPRVGDEIFFADLSTGDVTGAVWDFGDGSPPLRINYAESGDHSPKTIAHKFDKPGQYSVVLTSTGPGGATELKKLVEVAPDAPSIKSAFSVEEVEPLKHRFQNESSGKFASATWDFGDGSPPVTTTSFAEPIEHTFQRAGSYTVALLLVTDDGTVARAVETITVEGPFPWWIVWWALAAVAVALLGILLVRRRRRVALQRELDRLSGVISYKPSNNGAAWSDIDVATEDNRFEFALESPNVLDEEVDGEDGADWWARLAKSGDEAYTVELYRGAMAVDVWPIEPAGEDVGNSEFTFRYIT